VTERETFLRAFHAARPAATSRALVRTGIYERFAARVAGGPRVLDLACGDGHLTRLLGRRAIGVDMTLAERPMVVARAQELPFAGSAFDVVACQLAFMLFDEIEQVVTELGRVLRPGGQFVALLGGGPTADGHDAFHVAVEHMKAGRAFGDPRSKSEAGWRELFCAREWTEPVFDRWELDASGSFDEVWEFLGASYSLEAHDAARIAVRDQFPGEPVPLRIVMYCVSVIKR
jgi:SAM-dependent methyltransferase